ncbi:UMP kinase [bacterium]|nr:MAG: UMP kinase [bacterium]
MIYILSLGGSIIVPDEIDIEYLKKFRQTILRLAKNGDQFVIIPGGGHTCRRYQKAANQIAKAAPERLDWIGIAANRLHSYFLHAIFGLNAHREVVYPDTRLKKFREPVAITVGGIKPGWSSDTTSVYFAKIFKAKLVINLTDVKGVYDKDPDKYRGAKIITNFTWADYRKKFGLSRAPGQYMPFDSSAARKAKAAGLEVVVMSGYDLANLRNFISGRRFVGTTIGKSAKKR